MRRSRTVPPKRIVALRPEGVRGGSLRHRCRANFGHRSRAPFCLALAVRCRRGVCVCVWCCAALGPLWETSNSRGGSSALLLFSKATLRYYFGGRRNWLDLIPARLFWCRAVRFGASFGKPHAPRGPNSDPRQLLDLLRGHTHARTHTRASACTPCFAAVSVVGAVVVRPSVAWGSRVSLWPSRSSVV